MTSQVIICDQQPVYALGSAMLIHKHAESLSPLIIDKLSLLDEILVKEIPMVLVIESAMFNGFQVKDKNWVDILKNKIPVMVVLNEYDDFLLFQLIENGFSVIVSRNVSKEEWLKGIDMARKEKVFFSNDIAIKVEALANNMEDLHIADKVYQLSPYDKYILIRICQEAPSKLIAFELGHSKRTVEGHRTKMMQLFDVKNVAGLVKIAFISKLYENYLSNPGLYDITLCAKTSSL
jgi:DNA-binding NarL/FixJ family response regulator